MGGYCVSVNDTIASLRTTSGGNPDGTYTVTRTATGTRSHGRYTPGAATTFPIVAGIEPADPNGLQDLPAGQRADDLIQIFTDTELLTRTPTTDPDVITYRGEPWTVIATDFIEGFGEAHCEAKACRAPSPAGAVP